MGGRRLMLGRLSRSNQIPGSPWPPFCIKDTHSVTGRKLAHSLLFKRMSYFFSEIEDDQLWSRLIAALCRDLPDDFVSLLPWIVDSWVSLLKSGADREPAIIEQIFVAWSYILMYLQKSLLENNRLVDVLKILADLLSFCKINNLWAENTKYSFPIAIWTLDNYGWDMIHSTDCIAKVILEVVKKPLPVKNYGASTWLYFVMRGTMSRPYSRPDRSTAAVDKPKNIQHW
ncbi:hypothetical protein NC652_000017 [Populus alba x Populus x berolinensis]|nr:hypothetical protein NC652_000017 [Populus alba x Populus x berolinensis]